jgi:hypothetical protein
MQNSTLDHGTLGRETFPARGMELEKYYIENNDDICYEQEAGGRED